METEKRLAKRLAREVKRVVQVKREAQVVKWKILGTKMTKYKRRLIQ